MLESIRARLLLWHSMVLTILVVLYAVTVTYLYSQSLLRDIDAELTATSGLIAGSISPDISGTFDINLPPGFRDTAPADGAEATYYAVWNAGGDLVDRSEGSAAEAIAPPSPGVATRNGARELVVDGAGGARILVGWPLDAHAQAVQSLGLTVAGAGALILLLSFAGGSFLASRALAPVARISRTARAMVEGDLDARIPIHGTDSELEQVAGALNEAFDRMRTAAARQRQFTADASHELRTPIATLRAELDWAMMRPRATADYEGSIAKASHAVNRLARIANGLLALVTAEDRSNPVPAEDIELSALLLDTVTLLTPLATSRGVTMDTALQDVVIEGIERRLSDAFSNVLKNAIEYNREGGSVSVTMERTGDTVTVRVKDTGIGMTPDDLLRIFDRFYRAEQSRNRNAGGAGLGLAVAKSVVEEHDGTITCTSEIGVGSEFAIRLPAVPLRS